MTNLYIHLQRGLAILVISAIITLCKAQTATIDLQSLVGKWANLVSRNDYPDGSNESGVTGDYEPVKIYEDSTWSYYSKRGKIRFEPFTKEDAITFGFQLDQTPNVKIILSDFSNGDGVGYVGYNEQTGIPERLIIRFKIYYPREGWATWTQYKKG
jgi:hypothetical protein